MAILNSPFTTSKNAVMRSYMSLMASFSGFTQLIPSRQGSSFRYDPKGPSLSDMPEQPNPGVSLLDTLNEWARPNNRIINDVRNVAIQELDTGSSQNTAYDIYFHVDYDNEVHIDSILPADAPIIYNPNEKYLRNRKERITVKTVTPDKAYNDADPLVNSIQEKVNKKYNYERNRVKFQQDLRNIPERLLWKIREYKDPPTEERLIDIGSIA